MSQMWAGYYKSTIPPSSFNGGKVSQCHSGFLYSDDLPQYLQGETVRALLQSPARMPFSNAPSLRYSSALHLTSCSLRIRLQMDTHIHPFIQRGIKMRRDSSAPHCWCHFYSVTLNKIYFSPLKLLKSFVFHIFVCFAMVVRPWDVQNDMNRWVYKYKNSWLSLWNILSFYYDIIVSHMIIMWAEIRKILLDHRFTPTGFESYCRPVSTLTTCFIVMNVKCW